MNFLDRCGQRARTGPAPIIERHSFGGEKAQAALRFRTKERQGPRDERQEVIRLESVDSLERAAERFIRSHPTPMANVTDIEMYRDGGTIEFRVSNSRAGGFYRLQTPFHGTPEPLFKDGIRLDIGSTEELAVLDALRDWLAANSTEEVLALMSELDEVHIWLNLPERLSAVVPLHRAGLGDPTIGTALRAWCAPDRG